MDKANGKTLGITGAIVLITCSVIVLASAVGEKEASEKEKQYELITLTITAYSPDPKQTDHKPFEMASGRIAEPFQLEQLLFVAASRDTMKKYNLKYGDIIWIPFILEDTMKKGVKNTIDIFMRNKSLAKKFGRQTRSIIIEKK